MLSYRERKLRKRRARRQAAGPALPPGARGTDPLLHDVRQGPARALTTGGLLAAAVVLHAAVALAVVGMNRFVDGPSRVRQDRIEVEIREPPPPPPPPVEPEPVAEQEPPKPKPKRAKAPKPKPPPAQPPPEPAKPPPRRIVGLSFESTVQGGGGPAFAVGNTLLGQTAGSAVDPSKVKRGPVAGSPRPRTPVAARSNRAAAVVVQAGDRYERGTVAYDPEPEYPKLLEKQRIEGVVGMEAEADNRGIVLKARVVRPSAYPEFNRAALDHAYKRRYNPSRLNEKPIRDRYSYDLTFQMPN